MTNCFQCSRPTDDALSYLGEPLCSGCVKAEQADGTDESLAEVWARDHGVANHIYYVDVNGLVFEVVPGDGRDWTAVAMDDSAGVEIDARIASEVTK